jgi:PPP family 3-phenylpropionic acid transporter
MTGEKSVLSGRRADLLYALMQGLFWTCYCCVQGFAANLLQSEGFSSGAIGALLAIASLAAFLIQTPLASLADQSKKWNSAALTLSCALIIALTGALRSIRSLPPLADAFLLTIALAAVNATIPLLTGVMYLVRVKGGEEIRYGLCRSAGSLFYAVASVFLGVLMEKTSTAILGPASLVSGLLLAVSVQHLRRYCSSSPRQERPEASGSYRDLFSRHPSFLFLIIGCTLLYAGHLLVNNFMIYLVTPLGGSDSTVGSLLAFQAIIELPGMILGDRLARRLGTARMLAAALIAFNVKQLLFWHASSIAGLYGATLCHMVSFALFIPVSVVYAQRLASPENLVKAQACFSIATIAGSLLASLLGGRLLETIGLSPTMQVFYFLSLGGLILSLFSIDRTIR